MKNETCVMIAKREGGLEVFDPFKMQRSMAAAMLDSNCDARFAEALTRAVEMHLREWHDPSPPTSSYIFRCICTALTETGMEHVAQQMVLYRCRRATRRRRVSVFDSDRSRYTLLPWRKATVAGTLEGRYGLSHATARIMAGEVERQVLALDYSVVSTSLVRELTRNELLAWGLGDAVADLAPGALGVDAIAEGPPQKEC